MTKSVRKYYLISLAVLLALSAYPLVMGLKIVFLQLQNGGVRPEDYARYVIPYTAVCLSIVAAAALYPLLSRLKRLPVLAATAAAFILFVGIELYMESITLATPAARILSNSSYEAETAVTWQLLSCFQSPQAISAFTKNLMADKSGFEAAFLQNYNDAFKIHYFLISFVLIALIVSIFYGYGRAIARGDMKKKLPLRLQLYVAVLLLDLCVFANFTGFFRGRGQYQPMLPSLLTGLFFVVLGAAAGIYAGSWLIGRGRALSVWLPVVVAVLVCSVMYFGEYNLLAGNLYRFGRGWFFDGLPAIALAPADVIVVLLAGGATAGVMAAGRNAWRKPDQQTVNS